MKKTGITIATILIVSFSAYAGKQERDFMTKEVAPTVTDAQAKVKAACGCPMKIVVDETTVKSMDDLHGVKYIASEVGEAVTGYCTDAASKKAICQMKTLTLGKAKEATFTFKGGAGLATTDGQSNCSWDMMTRELDK